MVRPDKAIKRRPTADLPPKPVKGPASMGGIQGPMGLGPIMLLNRAQVVRCLPMAMVRPIRATPMDMVPRQVRA